MRRAAVVSLTAAGGLALLGAVIVARAARLQPDASPAEPLSPTTRQAAADPAILAGALRFRTVASNDSATFPREEFLGLHRHLESSFPLVHATLRREVVNGYSLLYTWQGSDSALAPVLLLSHMDVVPVEPGSESRWTHAPYAGDIADGFVWGRGTLDDKVGVVGILQAAELLLAEGFRPRRTIYFAFGHDEEIGGAGGAVRLAALIASRTPRVESVIDEGSVIAEGLIDGVSRRVALVGIAEKSSLSVELSAEAEGGHSSMPPPHTAVGTVSRAVHRLEESPMPARVTGVAELTFGRLAAEMTFARRAVFANLWLFRPLVARLLAGTPTGNAMIRTTTAATMLSGSPKENVLPSRATAVVNFRILPGDSVAGVLAHVRRVVSDTSVHLRVMGEANEPSAVSDVGAPAYAMLERTIRQAFPDAVVVPYLVVGATDARSYGSLSPNIYRFMPIAAGPEDLPRMHGTNERVSVAGYEGAVRFYVQLLRNTR